MSISKKLFFVLAALSVILLPVCAYLRISTCATGADPQIFISLARDILHHRFAEVAAFVVPGWPLYLAAVIHWFGPFAACWANVPLYALLTFVLWILLADLLGSRSRGAIAALFSAIALLAGFGHNPHFLLWAFRQTPIYLTSLLSLLFIRRATRAACNQRSRAAFGWLLASLAAALLATFVRETSALLLPVLFLHLLLDSGASASLSPDAPLPPFRRRLPLLIAFCALNLAALLAGLSAVFFLHLNVFNSQNLYIIHTLIPLLREHLLSFDHMLHAFTLVVGEFPWLLGFCLFLGTVAACCRRACRPFATLFLIPAVLNFLFEAFHKIHMRFFLTPVFYLAPLAALGAFILYDAVCNACNRRPSSARRGSNVYHRLFRVVLARLRIVFLLRRKQKTVKPVLPRDVDTSLPPGHAIPLLLLVAVWGAFVVDAIVPWGPRVSREEARQCIQTINAVSPAPDSVILLDPRSRYLREIVHLYSSRQIVDVTPANLATMDFSTPAIFVRPMDKHAFHPAVVALDAMQLLEFHGDLEPAPLPGSPPGSPPATIVVDSAIHHLYTVSAPAASSVDLAVPRPPSIPEAYPYPSVFLRVGAPNANPDAPIVAHLVRKTDPSNPILLSSGLRSGFNDLPVPVSALSANEPLTLRLTSSKPFPVTLPVAWNDLNSLHYEFGLFMYPRHDILSPEFHEFDDLQQPDPPFPTWLVAPRIREFNKPGTIDLPAEFDGHRADAPPVPSIFYTDFLLSAVHDLPEKTLTATVSFPDLPSIPPQSAVIPASSQGTHASFAWGNFPSNRLPPRIRLEVPADPSVHALYPNNRRSSSSRLHTLDLHRIALVDRLSIHFGDPNDGTFLLSGFYRPENLRTPRQGRWIADRADMLLPLPPADYSLVLDVDLSTLPKNFRASRPEDFTATVDDNPIPLTFNPLPDPERPEVQTHAYRVTGTIPATAFSAPNGSHNLRFAAPPFRPAVFGHPDDRALALFAFSLSITPLS